MFVGTVIRVDGCQDSTTSNLVDLVENASTKRESIERMNDLAYYLLYHCNDISAFDSIHDGAIALAEMNFNDELILLALSNYLGSIEKNYENELLGDRIRMMVDIAERIGDPEVLYHCWATGAEAAVKAMRVNTGVWDLGTRLAQKAKDHAIEIEDPVKKIHCEILLARALLYQDKMEQAYDHLIEASVGIQWLSGEEKESLEYELNGAHSNFFYMSRDWDEAGSYKSQQIEYLLGQPETDSLELMWNYYDLLVISSYAGRLNSTKLMEEMLDFAKRNNNEKLKDWTLAVYRNHLLQIEDYTELRKLYQERYPEELREMKERYPVLHCMVMGFICVAEDMDSSFVYFDEVEKLLSLETTGDNMASAQYARLGRVYQQLGDNTKAIECYRKSYEHAERISNEAFALDALFALEKLTLEEKDFESAYRYEKLKQEVGNRLMNWDQKQSIMRKSFSRDEVVNQINKEKANEMRKVRHARQNWLIAILLALAIIAMIMMTTYQVAEWVIEMMSFFTILCLFEFIILSIDHELHYMTDGAPLPMFGAKVALLSVLFPLHHIIERGVISYMKKRKRLKAPEDTTSFTVKRTIRKGLAALWPWLAPKSENDQEGTH